MTDKLFEELRELVAIGNLEQAQTLAGELLQTGRAEPYDEGRLAALRWYCAYMLDDRIDADSVTDLAVQEESEDFIAGVGNQLLAIEAYHLAEPVLERLTEMAPEDPRSWYSYGNLARLRGWWEPAVEALERAAELEPLHADTHYLLGLCYGETDAADKAAAAFQAYLSLVPDDLDALVLAGIALSDAGHFPEAMEKLERAIQLEPDSLSAIYNLAVVAFRADDVSRIATLEERLAELAPDNWRCPAAAALRYELQREFAPAWDERRAAFDRAAEAGDWEVLDNLAAGSLMFARRHEFTGQAAALIQDIYHHQCFSEAVLYELRLRDEPHLARATSYHVVLEGRIRADEIAEEQGEEQNCSLLGFIRGLGVYAETEISARKIALKFMGRLPGHALQINGVEMLDDVSDVIQGVYWCQEVAYSFKLEEADSTTP